MDNNNNDDMNARRQRIEADAVAKARYPQQAIGDLMSSFETWDLDEYFEENGNPKIRAAVIGPAEAAALLRHESPGSASAGSCARTGT